MVVTPLLMALGAAHTVLPDLYQSLYTAVLPFYANVQPVCQGGYYEVRSDKRFGFSHLADITM